MGKRKLERRLLEAAALGSLKKVRKAISKAESQASSETSASDDDGRRHKKRKERDEEVSEWQGKKGRRSGSGSDGRSSESEEREKHRRKKHKEKEIKKRRKKKKTHRSLLSLDCVDYDGWTPLHHAACGGTEDVVEYLLRSGAKVDVENAAGNTALHLAARKGHAKIIAALRKAGADMGRKNKLGEAPADLVQQKLSETFSRAFATDFDQRLEDEKEGWGVWGDETEEAREAGCSNRSAKGWDWFGEERAHRDGLGRGYNDDVEDLEPEDAWKDDIAEQMARKRSKQRQDTEEAFLENARREWEDMKKKKAAKEQESQRILEEEQKKDKAWRKSVGVGNVGTLSKKYEANWAAFCHSFNLGITLSDIPFPVTSGQDKKLKDIILFGIPEDDHRKRIREEVLRWHPDKFLQKFGKRILEKERDAILARVKETSQAVQDVYFSIGKEAT